MQTAAKINASPITPADIWRDVQAIRATKPLIHNITNYVVMEHTANALLALGASPVMAHAEQEVATLAAIAGALVLNIGTLDERWIKNMHTAHASAKCPVVLDPVGAGATNLRTQTARDILHNNVSVVRGNASEILSLFDNTTKTKGVDSTKSTTDLHLEQHAKNANCVLVASGATDIITDGTTTIKIENGNPIMAQVTGMGCAATAIIGAFLSVNKNPLIAAANAMAVMGICGEIAAQNSSGPGSFKPAFMDALYHLNEQNLTQLKAFS